MLLSHVLTPEILLESAPEDLAGALLKHLAGQRQSNPNLRLNLFNFRNDIARDYGRNDAIDEALTEVWAVLEREGFLVRDESDWYFISRRGEEALRAGSFDSFRVASLLPKDMLNPKLLPQVWGAFARGQYDTAVFEACKEVEITVRERGGFPDSLLGVDLIRKAFHAETGVLTDRNRHIAERQALSDLFAGAIGSYKNPNSHRRVRIEPKEAVEIIILASHLLTIAESRPVGDNGGS